MKLQRKYLTIIVIVVVIVSLVLGGVGLYVWLKPDSDTSMYYSATPLISYPMNRRNVLTKSGAIPNGAVVYSGENANMSSKCLETVTARYFYIKRNNSEYIQIMEVDFYDPAGRILAKNDMVASSNDVNSGLAQTYPPRNAIDGNYGTFNHSRVQSNANWFKVDFKRELKIGKIIITNRGSGHRNLIDRFKGCYLTLEDRFGREVWKSPAVTVGRDSYTFTVSH